MLKRIETHKSDISKTEDIYNENGELLFTIQYTTQHNAQTNDSENKYVIDYVRAHTSFGAESPLDALREMELQENQKNALQEPVLSFKDKRAQDPKWIECKKAAKILLRQGLRTQVKALLREYNKSHSMA
ncbi:MAG: hypothetical protein IKL90_01980 [Alphaproteobacteria bacterium]|nr:hypothetical protein [Alphaproteobacteria bacterium]